MLFRFFPSISGLIRCYYNKVLDIMITHRVVKILAVVVGLGVLSISGCANYLAPAVGVAARQEARVQLAADGVSETVWSTKDLELVYSTSQSGSRFNLTGKLIFDRSLTDSFDMLKSLSFKMSYLDEEGRVLKIIDITPLVSPFNEVPDELTVRSSSVRPAGAAYIAFNYFGVFRNSGLELGGDEWDIFYFPFER